MYTYLVAIRPLEIPEGRSTMLQLDIRYIVLLMPSFEVLPFDSIRIVATAPSGHARGLHGELLPSVPHDYQGEYGVPICAMNVDLPT